MNWFAKLNKVSNTAVFWTWVFNGLRLGSAVLLLPIILPKLTLADQGMHFTWVIYTGILVLLDATVALGIARNVAFAMQGVKHLQPLGLPGEAGNGTPNFDLLGKLLNATRHSYLCVSLIVFAFLAIVGTSFVSLTINQTSAPTMSWLGWAILIISAPLEIYTGAHLVFLRGMNFVLLTARLSTIVYGTKLVLSCLLLLLDFALLAVPVSTLAAATLQRMLAVHFSRKLIPQQARLQQNSNDRELIKVLWPTTWRFGLQLLSNYVAVVGCVTMANNVLGLDHAAVYSLSLNIIYTICQGMAAVWTSVKWPIISKLRAAHDFAGVKQILWPRIWLQMGTFSVMAGFVILVGPYLLEWWNPTKRLLPTGWLLLLALHSVLESHFSIWTTLLSTENRIPSLWTTFVTNLTGFGLAAILLYQTDLGIGSLILGPFISAACFIYWYWPWQGAKSLATGWFRFMFGKV